MRSSARQQRRHDRAVHIRESEVATLEAERQALVVEAEQVQQRGIEVVRVHRVARDVVSGKPRTCTSSPGMGCVAGKASAARTRVMTPDLPHHTDRCRSRARTCQRSPQSRPHRRLSGILTARDCGRCLRVALGEPSVGVGAHAVGCNFEGQRGWGLFDHF